MWGENGSMHEKWIELNAVNAARLRKKNEEKKRKGFKTPVLILRGKQQKRRISVEKSHTVSVCVVSNTTGTLQ